MEDVTWEFDKCRKSTIEHCYQTVCCAASNSHFFGFLPIFFYTGYDLSTESGYKNMMAEFERVIGFQYLKGVHLNDSKGMVRAL